MKKYFFLCIFSFVLLPALLIASRMEVRIYYKDPDELSQKMGTLFGELDICTV